jgi:hypothetical protein
MSSLHRFFSFLNFSTRFEAILFSRRFPNLHLGQARPGVFANPPLFNTKFYTEPETTEYPL